jgi:hypothetical protein
MIFDKYYTIPNTRRKIEAPVVVLFGCVCFEVFYTQDGTNMAQANQMTYTLLWPNCDRSATNTVMANCHQQDERYA